MNSNETNQPLISVIVPVYNIIPYLPRCVESLQKQTYPELEILLIDDGSTDDTPALCDRLAEHDPRIRVFHKENGGPSSARNFGLTQAAGAYVGFVDSDDYVDADMYERLYQAIATTHMPIAQVGRDEIDQDGNILPNICEPVSEEQVIPAEDFLKELLMHRGDCSFCTKLLQKDLFTKGKFPVGALNEDFHLLVKLLTDEENIVPGIACIPGQTYHVFYRPVIHYLPPSENPVLYSAAQKSSWDAAVSTPAMPGGSSPGTLRCPHRRPWHFPLPASFPLRDSCHTVLPIPGNVRRSMPDDLWGCILHRSYR